jgi:Flp pilus assembly protein TadB
VKLPLYLLAAALACAVYWVAARLSRSSRAEGQAARAQAQVPPTSLTQRRPGLPAFLEQLLAPELARAGWALQPGTLIRASLALAALGALLGSQLRNPPLALISAVLCALLPYQVLRGRIRRRNRAIQTAAGPALAQIARLYAVRHHPFLALTDALAMVQPPLRAELELALLQAQAGLPLPEALRAMAARCADNFYLHQLAELVAVHVREGGDLAASLDRLSARLRTMEELRAEEAAELFGYGWLTRLLFIATLAPFPYWILTGSPALQVYRSEPVARWVLVWVVLTGLVIASLPYWLATED